MHIVLDLDETCISSQELSTIVKGLEYFVIDDDTNCFKRPFLDQFLDWAFENHRVSFWSNGIKSYVLDIVKNICKTNQIPYMILWRTSCDYCMKETGGLKDFEWLMEKKIDLGPETEIVLVDDLKENCDSNPKNCYNIPAFNADSALAQNDRELVKLVAWIEKLQREK